MKKNTLTKKELTPDQKQFTETLRKFLAENKINQVYFADMIGKDNSAISRWLGKGDPIPKSSVLLIQRIMETWSKPSPKQKIKIDQDTLEELVAAYEMGKLDLSQLAKLDDIEDFRDRAIAAVGRMDIPVDVKGKVIDMLSKLEQMKVDK